MIKKSYLAPSMEDLGTVGDLTAFYGAPATYDTFINENGVIIDTGELSQDVCVSNNNNNPDCLAGD